MFMKQLVTFGVAALGTVAVLSSASDAAIKGAFALSGTTEKVIAELSVEETGPLSRDLLITFADKTTGKRIAPVRSGSRRLRDGRRRRHCGRRRIRPCAGTRRDTDC